MTLFDGLYRHKQTTMVWDVVGVTFSRRDEQTVAHVTWSEVLGARQVIGSHQEPGHVQVIVRGHIPPADPRRDPFSVEVASEADANRVVTSISWNSSTQAVREESPFGLDVR